MPYKWAHITREAEQSKGSRDVSGKNSILTIIYFKDRPSVDMATPGEEYHGVEGGPASHGQLRSPCGTLIEAVVLKSRLARQTRAPEILADPDLYS